MADMDTKAKPNAATSTAATPGDRAARLARAETLVKDHMLMSAAVGLIPAPGLDLAGGIAVQLTLLKRLTTLYGVTFSENAARGIIMSLLGGVGAGALAGGLFFSALKIVPGLGTLFGVASMPIALAAVTYGLGKVFIAHLELGGSLADFDAAANRGYFRDLVQRGRQVAASLSASPAAAKDPAKP
jgi:uncharacterized protein (DUF697 family)